MRDFLDKDDRIDLSRLWQVLEELEEGALPAAQCDELTALLDRSPAARRAYLEYFQQAAVLRLEAAKLHERGLLPVAGSAGQSRRIFKRSLVAAAAVIALAAFVAGLVAVSRPEPESLVAEVAAETRWSIGGMQQDSRTGPISVVEGSTVEVRSGTVRLELESGDQLVLQGPARAVFPDVRRPQLRHGWLWIDAAGSDEPFEVEAAGLSIRDIGTRFGVRVPEKGPPEVHLVSGRVEVRTLEGGGMTEELGEPGTARAFPAGDRVEPIEMASDPFPNLPDLLTRAGGYRTAVLGQSPVGYWACDAPENRHVANAVPGSSVGFFGAKVRGGEPGPGPADGFRGFPDDHRALYFTGSSENSVLSDLDGLHGVKGSEGAVSFWFRHRGGEIPRDEVLWLAGFGRQGEKVPNRAVLHTRLTSSGHLVFELRNSGDDVVLSSSRKLTNDRWHHVAASWGPESVDLFIDGRLVARDAEPRTLEDVKLRGRFVRFGKPSKDLMARYDFFHGWADEMALWDRPLTGVEVALQFQTAQGEAP